MTEAIHGPGALGPQKTRPLPLPPGDQTTERVCARIFGKPPTTSRTQPNKSPPPPSSRTKDKEMIAQLQENAKKCLEALKKWEDEKEKPVRPELVLLRLENKAPSLVKIHKLLKQSEEVGEHTKASYEKTKKELRKLLNASDTKRMVEEVETDLESTKPSKQKDAKDAKELLKNMEKRICDFQERLPTSIATDKTKSSFINKIKSIFKKGSSKTKRHNKNKPQ